MPTMTALDEPIPVAGYKQPVREALDLDGYETFAAYIHLSNMTKHGATSKATVRLWHAVRNRAGDFKQLGSDHDFTDNGGEIVQVSEFARYLLVEVVWDDAAGGDCDAEVLVNPKN